MFTFLECVAPQHGGTLAVSGSYRLLSDLKTIGSKEAKRRLQREPCFRALMSDEAGDRQHFFKTPICSGQI